MKWGYFNRTRDPLAHLLRLGKGVRRRPGDDGADKLAPTSSDASAATTWNFPFWAGTRILERDPPPSFQFRFFRMSRVFGVALNFFNLSAHCVLRTTALPFVFIFSFS
jgi:hypothetical protein